MNMPDLTVEEIHAINRSFEDQSGVMIDDACVLNDDELCEKLDFRKLGRMTVKALQTQPNFANLNHHSYDSYCDSMMRHVTSEIVKYKSLDIFE